MKEAFLQKKLGNERIMCTACNRYCKLRPNQTGFCGVRKNVKGKLMLLVHGFPAAIHVDPIEKKPLFHFYPGTRFLSIGTTGCNFACFFCQNWDLSQRREIIGTKLTPKQAVRIALDYGCKGISYTYNEPTIFFEYAYDTGKLARKHGLVNMFVTNGYESEEAIKMVGDFLDAAAVDLKGNANPEFYKKYILIPSEERIFETLLRLKDAKLHIEITDLVVPKIGDKLEDVKKLARWIADNLGPETPLHFLRFFPHHKLSHLPPTPVEVLEKHWKVAKEVGLKYVYLGNVPGHKFENTYCPNCNTVVLQRFGVNLINNNLDGDECKNCGEKVDVKV